MDALRAENLTKHYHRYRRPSDRLIELVTRRRRHDVFTALEAVSFHVQRGETIGLIGENGAGKSTLLKLICGVTQPTSGTIEAGGTIASILELGTGFHPDFSGRSNAALSAAILGLDPVRVREILPSILEFSELGEFVDQPVKTYSSGMFMRLAFAVAVNIDPDILVIDEALAVGDGHFQKKCIDRIREFQKRGKTILFCSHALYYISTMCDRVVWLDRGRVRGLGPAVDVVHDYEKFLLARDTARPGSSTSPAPTGSPVRIRQVEVRDGGSNLFSTGEDIPVRLEVEADDPSIPIHILLGVVRSADEMQCFAVGTNNDGLPPFTGQRRYQIELQLRRVPLVRGDYGFVIFAGDEHAMHIYDRKDVREAFSIGGDRYEIGLVSVDHEWQIRDSSDRARDLAGVAT